MAFRHKNTTLSKCTGYFYEGKEIVLTKHVGASRKQLRHSKHWWPDDKKIEAATLYAVIRNFKQVSDLTGVSVRTLEQWTLETWWTEAISKVIKLKNEELDGKITQALDKGLDIILDRFTNGEIFIDRKTKDQYRVPMSTKNTALATDILFDKRQLLRGEATTRTETITQEQRLLALKDQFEKLAASKGINTKSEPIEGELINAEFRDNGSEGVEAGRGQEAGHPSPEDQGGGGSSP